MISNLNFNIIISMNKKRDYKHLFTSFILKKFTSFFDLINSFKKFNKNNVNNR